MASLAPYIFPQALDDNGDPLAGGLVYAFEAGTSTPKNMYTSAAGTTPTANPFVLNSAGRGAVWLESGGYDFELRDADGNLIDTREGVQGSVGGGDGDILFVDTISDVRALTAGISAYVFTAGYASKGDLEPLVFYWDAESTGTDDGYSILTPGSAPASGRWLNLNSVIEIKKKVFGSGGSFQDGVKITTEISKGTRLSPTNIDEETAIMKLAARGLIGGSMTDMAVLQAYHEEGGRGRWDVTGGFSLKDTLFFHEDGRVVRAGTFSTNSAEPTAVAVSDTVGDPHEYKSRVILNPDNGVEDVLYCYLTGAKDGQCVFVQNVSANNVAITNSREATWNGIGVYLPPKFGAILCWDETLSYWFASFGAG